MDELVTFDRACSEIIQPVCENDHKKLCLNLATDQMFVVNGEVVIHYPTHEEAINAYENLQLIEKIKSLISENESLKEQIEDMSLDLGKRAFIEPI